MTVNMTPEKLITFNVCDYDEEKEYLSEGIGYGTDFQTAKEKFAVCSGLVPEPLLLSAEQKGLCVQALEFALEEGMDMYWDEEIMAQEMISSYDTEWYKGQDEHER